MQHNKRMKTDGQKELVGDKPLHARVTPSDKAGISRGLS
jgi:hypothetical protein